MGPHEYVTKYGQEDVRRQVFIAICLNIGHVIIGYTICWSAPVLHKLKDHNLTPLNKPLTDAQASWLTSIFYLGCIAGSQTGAFLSNVIGRKPTLLLFAVLLFTSNIIMLMAKNFTTLIIGRIVSSLGAGATASGNLVYLGEIASSHLRGTVLASTGVLHAFGGLLIFSVGPYVSYSVVESILILLTALHVLGLLYISESPAYHVIKGNEDAARNTLHYLGRDKDIDKELKIMIENTKTKNILYTQIQATKTIFPRWSWLDIFRRKSHRKAFLITSTMLVVQVGAGIICILSYATTIFKNAASSVDPDIATIILGVTQVFGILFAPFLVEKFGRRPLLLFSTSTCSLFEVILAGHFYLEHINHPILVSIRWVPLATLMAFLFCFNAGLGIIPNVLVGEMFSPNIRSTASGIVMCFCYLTDFVSSLSFDFIITAIGSHMIFLVFAIINALGCIFTFKLIPETKGKSLMEIEAMLAK